MGSQGTKRPAKSFHNYKSKRLKLDRKQNEDKKFSKYQNKTDGKRNQKTSKNAGSRFKRKPMDKTNSKFRDHRPIGGKANATKNKSGKFKKR